MRAAHWSWSRASAIAVLSCIAMLPTIGGAADTGALSPEQLRAEAEIYENGEGVAKDPLHAFELYCEAARQGDAQAQYNLAWMYLNGRGLARNDELAAAFLTLAAEQGHSQARAMLARVTPPRADLPQCMRERPAVAQYDDTTILLAQESVPPPAPVESYKPATALEEKVAALVEHIAPEYQVSPLLALAFIRAESNFNASARSPRNAQGLMQLIPETSARFNVKKPYDPVQNIRGGLAYLRWLLAYFRGSVPLVAAAYNAGEGTVERYRGIPPYAETREYVKRILSIFRLQQHPFDPTVTEPSPELDRIRTKTLG